MATKPPTRYLLWIRSHWTHKNTEWLWTSLDLGVTAPSIVPHWDGAVLLVDLHFDAIHALPDCPARRLLVMTWKFMSSVTKTIEFLWLVGNILLYFRTLGDWTSMKIHQFWLHKKLVPDGSVVSCGSRCRLSAAFTRISSKILYSAGTSEK